MINKSPVFFTLCSFVIRLNKVLSVPSELGFVLNKPSVEDFFLSTLKELFDAHCIWKLPA